MFDIYQRPDEEIEEIKVSSLDDVKKFYKDFYGASNGGLAAVGDFDAKESRKWIDGFIWFLEEPAVRSRRIAYVSGHPLPNKEVERRIKLTPCFLHRRIKCARW